ncbi:MAG: hypothetical protein RLZ10_995 [Bacteroidota bacterium]|jgi:hypothetical protein
MKKVILSIGSCAFLTLIVSLQHVKMGSISSYHFQPQNGGGAVAGRTGAPGEQNCTACHAGTAQNGANENVLTLLNGSNPVTQYSPGQQYTVTLAMSSNPTKKGFQSTALTASNTMAGTFTGQAGNTSINGTTKKYANHTSASNTSSSAPVWSWTWTAPAAGSGDVTFYVATNKANNNGNDNGDVIYLSQHVFSEVSSAGLNDNDNGNFDLYFDSKSNTLVTTFNSLAVNAASIKIYDLTGKEVFFSKLGMSDVGSNKLSVELDKNIGEGIYIATMQIGSKVYSKKIRI